MHRIDTMVDAPVVGATRCDRGATSIPPASETASALGVADPGAIGMRQLPGHDVDALEARIDQIAIAQRQPMRQPVEAPAARADMRRPRSIVDTKADAFPAQLPMHEERD